MRVLAGDIGGTHARLAVYDGGQKAIERVYPSARYPSLDAIGSAFLGEIAAAGAGAPERACLAIAGPVEGDACRATNLPWIVEARALEARLGLRAVRLINDFHAAALGVTTLDPGRLVPLGGGARAPEGPIAVLGPGTGLGQAFLAWSAPERRYQVLPSEGGHADFAPRTPIERGLLAHLAAKHGRVSWERVLSGPGLRDLFAFLADEPACRPLVRPETRAEMAAEDPAAVVSRRGLDGSDPVCRMALSMFAALLGSLAGSLALTLLATGGVFVAGGIAPRIAGFLAEHAFREAFDDKGRLSPTARRIPAFVVTDPDLGLLGAAEEASRLP